MNEEKALAPLAGGEIPRERPWRSGYAGKSQNPAIDAFLDEVATLSKKHGLSISHEDTEGGFIVEEFSEDNIDWLQWAADGTVPKRNRGVSIAPGEDAQEAGKRAYLEAVARVTGPQAAQDPKGKL